MAIRLAECMGLHRDGTHYGLSPVEVHIRRLIWYQLCFLDLRTCEATGPRPQIRKEDYDTRFPLNVDDAELEASTTPTEDASRWTEMTIARIRFECNEMHRTIWVERARIARKKSSLTSLLTKIEDFRAATEKKYMPLIDCSTPLGLLAYFTYGILSFRMHVMALSHYITRPRHSVPDRFRRLVLNSAINSVEHAVALETTPVLTDWVWYSGALQQYHSAILLLIRVHARPDIPEADRVWRCLDYIFMVPPDLPRTEKSRLILGELRDRVAVFQSLRKVRAPKDMPETLTAEDYQDKTEPDAPISSVLPGLMDDLPADDEGVEGALPPQQARPSPRAGSEGSGSQQINEASAVPDADIVLDIDWVSLIHAV